MEITRHFTSTVVIVYQDKVLLHAHQKLGLWLPVGGHIDRDELPTDAALREVKEETGLEVTLYQDEELMQMNDAQELIRPQHLLLEDINEFHQHIDFIYYATSITDEVTPEDGVADNYCWLTKEEVEALDAPDNVKELCFEALELLSH